MLFVGAFGRYKGLDVLLRAYAESWRMRRRW